MKLTGRSPSGGVLNGFLDQGCLVVGELRFDDTLRLDGAFRGKISSERELIVGDSGDFDGEIDVGRVAINGRVRGIVRAKERIEIHPNGRVDAELITPVLIVEEGAVVEGKIVMGPPRGSAAGEPPAVSPKGDPTSERRIVALAGGKGGLIEPAKEG